MLDIALTWCAMAAQAPGRELRVDFRGECPTLDDWQRALGAHRSVTDAGMTVVPEGVPASTVHIGATPTQK